MQKKIHQICNTLGGLEGVVSNLNLKSIRGKLVTWILGISRDKGAKIIFFYTMLQSDFRSLRVRAFDPQSNFASILMFENFYNFS